jgi:hypothetical protein
MLEKIVMNQMVKPIFQGDVVDILLADLAIRVQLSPTLYNLAVARADTLSQWIDRPDSTLSGRVVLTYPQGSMAYNATIARRLRTDEYDIDIIAQIIVRPGMTAKQVLDELYQAVRGEPGSRYYKMVERRNRCVTIHYADGMHLDITPARLVEGRSPRTSYIYNHKPEDKADLIGYALLANPYGFGEWFKARTPATPAFAQAYMARVQKWAADHEIRADMEDVPEQQPPHEKSMAVIALQLLKRNRNVRYDARPGRRPPSVMLSKFAADAATQTGSLFDQLLRLAQYVRDTTRLAHDQGRLVSVTNPACAEDVFTDRWPANRRDQEVYLSDLDHLIGQLHRLQQPDCGLPEMQEILSDLFGETPTLEVVKSYVDRLGGAKSTGSIYQEPRTGRIDVVRSGLAAPAIAGSSSARSFAAPAHTNFGSEPPPR